MKFATFYLHKRRGMIISHGSVSAS